MGPFSCFSCGALVPEDHIELSREQLKKLYEKSIAANNGRLIVHGIFARSDTRNNNKRVYPKHILKREVARFEVEHILRGTALGELDHPNYASRYFKCLNLPNASHQVLEVKWKGDQLWGTIEILPTPSGLLLWELYSQGIKLGVSSRGWASLRTDPSSKCVYVDEDFELITFDFVTEPSTHGAYLVPVQRRYKRTSIPDQRKLVQVCHLGHGVVAMEKIFRLPEPNALVQRIAALQRSSAASTAGLPMDPTPLSPYKPSTLDNLLCYSHYIVHQDAPYLHQEQHARDYRAHLAIFATRAHLSDQTQVYSRSDIDRVVLDEIATKDNFDPASKSFAIQLGCPRALNDSREHSPAADKLDALYAAPLHNDLGSWSLHPNALATSGSSGYNAASSSLASTPGGMQRGGGLQACSPLAPHQQQQQQAFAAGRLPNQVAQPGSPTVSSSMVLGPALPPGRHPQPQHPQHQQVPPHLHETFALVYSSQPQQQPLQPQQQSPPPPQQHVQHQDSWLGQIARDARVAKEFQQIRSTLTNYAQLYHVHQAQVERALLMTAAVPVH